MVEFLPEKIDDSLRDQAKIKLICHVLWPEPTVSVRSVKLTGATGTRPQTGGRTAILLAFSIPKSWCLFRPFCGRPNAGNWGSMYAASSRRHRRRKSRSKSAPRSTLRNLSNKLKIGQQFFTHAATAEIARESVCESRPNLWKSKSIRLF